MANILPGQSSLISHVAQEIRRELCLCKCLPRPLGRFFLAETGCTVSLCLARGLAQFLFHDKQAVLHLPMEKYSEKHTISALIGHCGGLVQPYFEGELTYPLWRQPQMVVVMSQIERMHTDGWSILMPILTEGAIFDGLGRTVRFDNSIFVMTTTLNCIEDIEAAFQEEWLRTIYPLIAVQA